MNKFLSVLNFLNLLDRNKKLSITNVAVIVAVTKLALVPQATIIDIGTVLVTLLNYSHKRFESNKQDKQIKEQEAEAAKAEALKINQIESAIQKLQAEVAQTQSTVSSLSLASSLRTK